MVLTSAAVGADSISALFGGGYGIRPYKRPDHWAGRGRPLCLPWATTGGAPTKMRIPGTSMIISLLINRHECFF